ncbi:MAG: RdgB/HAM1 family non-canonical purine NTP pyrophosphatase [Candidatus Hodarchaeales archaeon]|jgi:XTP/dITP diphosphohydrolase
MVIPTKLLFGTSNKHKLAEARDVLDSHGFDVVHYPVDLIEPQDSSLEYIARYSLECLPATSHPIFVEDTGLFINHLNGFPGPFASFTLKTIGNEGILNLMRNIKDREAYFESIIAFRDEQGTIHTFSGRINGNIAEKISGTEWGFDPIFIPDSDLNPLQKTFAILETKIKNKISHRARALVKLRDFIVEIRK